MQRRRQFQIKTLKTRFECENNERQRGNVEKCFTVSFHPYINFFCSYLSKSLEAKPTRQPFVEWMLYCWIVPTSSCSTSSPLPSSLRRDNKVQKKWNCFSNSADCRLHLKCFVFHSHHLRMAVRTLVNTIEIQELIQPSRAMCWLAFAPPRSAKIFIPFLSFILFNWKLNCCCC